MGDVVLSSRGVLDLDALLLVPEALLFFDELRFLLLGGAGNKLNSGR
jgi:hypothetical protein